MSMHVRVLGAYGSALQEKRPCGFLVDDTLMIDGGTISSAAVKVDLTAIDHVLISHAHLDHIKDIAFLPDLIFGQRKTPVAIWGTEEVMGDIKKHLFNNRLWPDFTVIPPESPMVSLNVIPHKQPVKIGKYTVTAFPVNHPVPADGFLIDNGHEVLMYSGDTGETDEIWAAAAAEERLGAVFVETAFPNNMRGVADVSGHLVPGQLPTEVGKLGSRAHRIPVHVYHIKPHVEAEVRKEIEALNMANVTPVEQDEVISVSLVRT